MLKVSSGLAPCAEPHHGCGVDSPAGAVRRVTADDAGYFEPQAYMFCQQRLRQKRTALEDRARRAKTRDDATRDEARWAVRSRVLGHRCPALRAGAINAAKQQVVINVVNLDLSKPDKSAPSISQEVPDWWNIYEGLTDEEIEELDQASEDF